MSVCVKGDTILYGSDNYLKIADAADPSNPIEIGETSVPGNIYSITVRNEYAYLADIFNGLRIIDISDPSHPTEVGHYNNIYYTRQIVVRDNYAYVACEGEGLKIINISNPMKPLEEGSYETPGRAYSVALKGNYAYLAATNSGIRVIDISDPSDPFEAGYYPTEGYAYDLTIQGFYLFVAEGAAGLRIFNISNPLNIKQIGYYDTDGLASGISVEGNHAFVNDGIDSLFLIFDVSEVYFPQETGCYKTATANWSSAVNGELAFVASDGAGLYILDCSLAPTLLQSFNIRQAETKMELSWDISSREGITGFKIYRTTNEEQPMTKTTSPTIPITASNHYEYTDNDLINGKSYTYTLAVRDSDGSESVIGERTVTYKLPNIVYLCQNRPNPFNPSTSIECTLAEPAHLNLSVYDINGKLVKTIFNGDAPAGSVTTSWDGKNKRGEKVPSGIYFCRLSSAKQTKTIKMVLLK